MENAKCYAPQILVGTEGLPREQWLEYRRKGIGGSDAAAVLGISPFRTGRDLYYDKLNIVTADDAENWVQLEVGTLLEPLVAKIFAHKTGYKIYRRPFMFQHPLYPWMLADLDYMVELPDGTTAILEIKTTNYNAKDIREEINPASPETPEIVYAGKIFRLNDRVMQMRNNYDIKLYDRSGKQVGEGVFNGDIGTIRKISGTNVVIEFDGRYMDCPQVLLDDLELSYAITIHKSMGSEYDTVIIPLLAAHNVLLTRNLLYTAITRAKRRVLLVGEKRALYMAIHRSRKGKRNTMLGERIALYYKAVTRKALRSEEGEEWQRAS